MDKAGEAKEAQQNKSFSDAGRTHFRIADGVHRGVHWGWRRPRKRRRRWRWLNFEQTQLFHDLLELREG